MTFVNQPYVLPQITVLLSANRTWSAALEAKNIEHRQPGWISKPYRGHLRCASQDLSSDNSCSHSHRTCISSTEVHELGLIAGEGKNCENLCHFWDKNVIFKFLE